jgi:hypothetical protein
LIEKAWYKLRVPSAHPARWSKMSSLDGADGLRTLQGHGIRIGGTHKYPLWNIPFEVAKVKGRWSSDAFLNYLVTIPKSSPPTHLHAG